VPVSPNASQKKIRRHPLIEQLVAQRVRLKLTQREVAAKVNGPNAGSPIWRWETEGRNPSLHNFIAWVNALGGIVTIEFPPEKTK
jgi:transcriptional regulator with XRE-family HTH domain